MAEVVFARFLLYKVTLSSLSILSLLEGSHYGKPTLAEWELHPTLSVAYLHQLFVYFLYGRFVSLIYLLFKSLIYFRMNSWIHVV